MLNFKTRSLQKELLDAPNIPAEAIFQNMRELNIINTLLGGHRITQKAFRILAAQLPSLHIMEIGCGGGDNLRVIQETANKSGQSIQLSGVDLNQDCITFARQNNPEINWICSDYRNLTLDNKPDIIFSSLFCHHFTDEELTEQLQWMHTNSKCGFFINDLHRHPFAYYSIRWLTKLFSSSYLVKQDAPLSVLRGFKRDEWKTLLSRAGIQKYSLQWAWAFRYRILVQHDA